MKASRRHMKFILDATSGPTPAQGLPTQQQSQPPVHFGQTEIAQSSVSNFDTLLEHCRNAAAGGSIFRNFQGTLTERLAPAYALFRAVQGREDGARIILKALASAKLDVASKSKKKTALLAVYLTCLPEAEADRKTCSDWACLLSVAMKRDIPVEAFRNWSSTITVRDAKKECARRRGETSVGKSKIEIDPLEYPCLAFALTGSDAAEIRQKIALLLREFESNLAAAANSTVLIVARGEGRHA